ncbi:hypothetical protein TUN205_08899, partial [Pyrenophora tritici-repentis]
DVLGHQANQIQVAQGISKTTITRNGPWSRARFLPSPTLQTSNPPPLMASGAKALYFNPLIVNSQLLGTS